MWRFLIGMACAAVGATVWYMQDARPNTTILDSIIALSILLLLTGGYQIVRDVPVLGSQWVTNVRKVGFLEKAMVFTLIYFGTVAYTLAAFYHLKLSQWTFVRALALAVPLVLIEYQFSLRGNYLARSLLQMNNVQIALVTMVFYFLNAWLLNLLVLKSGNVVWWRELMAFSFICAAFLTTTAL
jgi:hypothetical protein